MSETTVKRECSKCGNPFDVPEEAAPIVDAASEATKGQGGVLCPTCFKIWHDKQPAPEEVFVAARESEKYKYTDDMREISGFGGGYEQTCRNMVIAGCQWFDEHPEANPRFTGMKGVIGICMEDNDDAKALTAVVTEAAFGDLTGAMHQATISHILTVKKLGWDEYCKVMRAKRDE